ncbi:MAG: cobalamin-dependent protein [Gammaproteobacteria bacterium]|nr:cobalamin-dependent protein [Gammaproteobacteria bacterium]
MKTNTELALRAARFLEEHQETIAATATGDAWQQNPHWIERYGEAGRARCYDDAGFHLTHLRQAVQSDSPNLYHSYLEWGRELLINLKLDGDDISRFMQVISDSLPQITGEEESIARIRSLIDSGEAYLEQHPYCGEMSFMPSEGPLAELAARYLQLVLALKRKEACQLIMKEVDSGLSIRDIYLELFQPVQREVGLLWQRNQISVAAEHYCTATTQWVMSQLYPMIFSENEPERRVLTTCVGGNLHEIGIRMVADLFELSGWDSMFVGANMPLAGILDAIDEFEPHLLAISVTLTTHLPQLEEVIATVRRSHTPQQLPIMVGGLPFHYEPNLWQQIGADATAIDAEQAVNTAIELLEHSA